MIHGHIYPAVLHVRHAVDLTDGNTRQEESHGIAPERHNDLGIDDLDLAVEVTATVCDLVRLRITVPAVET